MLDYKKMTAKDIKDFLNEKNLSKEEKREFYKYTHPSVNQKLSKKVFDADGKPVMYQIKNKDKSLKYDTDGKPVMRQKIEMVEKQDGNVSTQFSMIKAKEWVVNNYPDEVKNKPKKKEETAKDPFADWA